ncbi:hypothetical protein ACJA88_005845 [Fusarium oxysporum]
MNTIMDHDIAATATMHPAFATALASLSEEGAGNCTENPMLWNWNTIGTCFISKAWYMDSGGKFGITCFGAFMLCIITYILILMAVSFNGYIIISMFIGAYVGALCFQRDPLTETRNPNAYQRAFQQPVVCCV